VSAFRIVLIVRERVRHVLDAVPIDHFAISVKGVETPVPTLRRPRRPSREDPSSGAPHPSRGSGPSTGGVPVDDERLAFAFAFKKMVTMLA